VDIKEKDSNSILKGLIIEALGTVYDPEIPVSIWELGLVYNIDIDEKFNVLITMTLTTPNCPEAETIPDRVAEAVSKCKDVEDVRVEIVWEPTWTQDNMSEAAKLELGFF
jgi:FeS assembly SUF system protein|tara:strand:+ start:102 stop:431 length:330 start_codon:yes stop_codon:yes gene_type:complete